MAAGLSHGFAVSRRLSASGVGRTALVPVLLPVLLLVCAQATAAEAAPAPPPDAPPRGGAGTAAASGVQLAVRAAAVAAADSLQFGARTRPLAPEFWAQRPVVHGAVGPEGAQSISAAGKLLAIAAYGTTYGVATKVGSRLGLSSEFKVVRLESAYLYDAVGHAFVVRELGGALTTVTRAAGYPYDASRTAGVWWGAFGSELYMEAINGFMPGVRFDPLDPVANFVGAWLASGGRDLARRHPGWSRFSFEFGYRSWSRAFGPAQDSATLGNLWHDHPNGRFGVGYAVGPGRRPWVSIVGSYEITSLELAELRNRFGIGLELHPLEWFAGPLARHAAGRAVLGAYRWLDARVLLPGLYLQLAHVDARPFSSREPFDE